MFKYCPCTRCFVDIQTERRLLLTRLFYSDRDFYQLGKATAIQWFDIFDPKFRKDKYAYFAPEEKLEVIDKLVRKPSDRKLVNAINTLLNSKQLYFAVDRFVGEHYYFDGRSVELTDRTPEIEKSVKNVLAETKGRVRYFLKALILLHREDRWDKAYRGAAWPDILAKIRELGGTYPAPRDLVLLQSYKLYYRTGSRRYPTHTIPEEIIPIVESILASAGATWSH